MRLKGFVLTALAALIIMLGVNVLRVQMPARATLKYTDDFNVAAYYRFGVMPDSIVFDLWRVGDDASAALIMGRFFQFAEEMNGRSFREVRLAYKGKTKFILDGDDFAQIGKELAWQKPIYIVRTFPEKLKRPDGRDAFSTWTGGMLGVLNAQMEDVNQAARDWYLDDLIRSR